MKTLLEEKKPAGDQRALALKHSGRRGSPECQGASAPLLRHFQVWVADRRHQILDLAAWCRCNQTDDDDHGKA